MEKYVKHVLLGTVLLFSAKFYINGLKFEDAIVLFILSSLYLFKEYSLKAEEVKELKSQMKNLEDKFNLELESLKSSQELIKSNINAVKLSNNMRTTNVNR